MCLSNSGIALYNNLQSTLRRAHRLHLDHLPSILHVTLSLTPVPSHCWGGTPLPCPTCSLAHILHFSQPTQSMMRVMLWKVACVA